MEFDKLPVPIQLAAAFGTAIAAALAAFAGRWLKSSSSTADHESAEELRRELDKANLAQVMREQRDSLMKEIFDNERQRSAEFSSLQDEVQRLRERVAVLENRSGGRR